MNEVSEGEMIEAIKIGHEQLKFNVVQMELASEISSSTPKREYCHETHDEELRERIKNDTYDKVYAVASEGLRKDERSAKFSSVKEEWTANLSEEEIENYDSNLIDFYYHNVEKKW